MLSMRAKLCPGSLTRQILQGLFEDGGIYDTDTPPIWPSDTSNHMGPQLIRMIRESFPILVFSVYTF